ncbi:Uncharacterised protein [Mycoplasmopsis glycophila]|uniref:Uncharacterized protein n=2 Tax=Mycoplasmopsis glycophila TaxID=171285 RepID=A0A449AVD4_9BACT|nr:Uncharacterised protein [Mycoplasmopsis glycophila]
MFFTYITHIKWYNRSMSYSLCKKKQNGKYYLVLAISKGFKKGYENQIGLGYWEDIKEKYRLSSIEDMKEIAKK